MRSRLVEWRRVRRWQPPVNALSRAPCWSLSATKNCGQVKDAVRCPGDNVPLLTAFALALRQAAKCDVIVADLPGERSRRPDAAPVHSLGC